MTNAYDRDQDGEGSAEAPTLVPGDTESPKAEDPAAVDAHDAAPSARVRPRSRRRAPVFAREEGGNAERRPSSNDEASARLETRGRADAIVVPILGTVVGLMALGALGIILISQRKSQSRTAALLAALNTVPAHWAESARNAERGVASDLSGRVSRFRRYYGI